MWSFISLGFHFLVNFDIKLDSDLFTPLFTTCTKDEGPLLRMNLLINGPLNACLFMLQFVAKKIIWLLQSRVSDLNLDEDEILKLATFGNGANSQVTIDILRRSLVMRNK